MDKPAQHTMEDKEKLKKSSIASRSEGKEYLDLVHIADCLIKLDRLLRRLHKKQKRISCAICYEMHANAQWPLPASILLIPSGLGPDHSSGTANSKDF